MAYKKYKISGLSDLFLEEATATEAGLMSAEDKTKLDSFDCFEISA